jgi:hypothetical protein
MVGRAAKLERLGLAEQVAPGCRTVQAGHPGHAARSQGSVDIIKTMHRAMTGAGHEPKVSSFALHGDDAADLMLGRLVAREPGTKDVGRLARINNSPTLYQSGLRCLSPVFAS